LFYFYESGSDKSASYVVRPQFSLLDNRVENTSYSAFAHFSYDVTEKLGLTAGGRITHDKRYIDFQNRNQTTLGVSDNPLYLCPLQPELGPNNGSLCHFEKKVTFTEPTWNLGVNYRLSDQAMVYASVARGYRSGGFTQGAVAVASTIPFRPEKALNLELGLKSDFDVGGMATRLNLAGYYTDYKDLQRTTNNLAVGSGGIVNTTFNAAKAHIWGAEADLSVRPHRDLELSLSYAYTAPRYDQFNDVYRDPISGDTFTVDISDSTFILNSKHSLSANASYTLPLPEKLGQPTISASYYYRSSFFVTNDINTPNCSVPGNPNPNAFYTNCYLNGGKLPGYSVVNARLDWRTFLGLGMDVAVFVKNVTNKYYFANGLNALAATGTLAVQPAPPRTFGVEVRVPFGAMRY
jgi:iron complex outermembrane receptor protein